MHQFSRLLRVWTPVSRVFRGFFRVLPRAFRVLPLFFVCFTTAQAQSLSFIRDAEIEATLKRMSTPIFQAAGISPDSIKIFMVNDRSLNAFVVGRNMVFHTGLMEKLESPNELYGVIAHETAHIAGGHALLRSNAASSARGPLILGTILGIAAAAAGQGGVGGAIIAGSQTVAQRNILKYTRGQESSADQAAIGYLESVRVDPSGMVRTLERLKAVEIVSIGNSDPYTRTHPLTTQRIKLLQQRVARSSSRNAAMNSDIAYWHSRMRAKLRGFLGDPLRVLRQVPASDRSENATLMRAVAYHRSPDLPAAIREADKLLVMRPNDPYYHELKGQFLFESGDARGAVASYQRAVTLAPDEPLLQVAYGRALLALGDEGSVRRAREALLSATRADRLDSSGWRQLATAESRLGNELNATLATAEFQALQGSLKAAERNAKRVQQLAPTGSPSWLRADDLIAAVERGLKER
jgi:predicted Zn-dependent protease